MFESVHSVIEVLSCDADASTVARAARTQQLIFQYCVHQRRKKEAASNPLAFISIGGITAEASGSPNALRCTAVLPARHTWEGDDRLEIGGSSKSPPPEAFCVDRSSATRFPPEQGMVEDRMGRWGKRSSQGSQGMLWYFLLE